MDKKLFDYKEELTNRLRSYYVSREETDDDNLLFFTARFKSGEPRTGETIFYTVRLNINRASGGVEAREKILVGQNDYTLVPSFKNTKITGNDGEVFPLEAILEAIKTVTVSKGYTFTDLSKTEKEKKDDPQMAGAVPAYPPGGYQNGYQKKKKNNKIKIIVISVVVLIISAIIIILASGGKKPEPSSESSSKPAESGVLSTEPASSQPAASEPAASEPENAYLSVGVGKEDLGNIMNNQFYFATAEKKYYPGFDGDNNTHIYSANLDGSELTPIFDGFGWSLVVKDEWLYFAGNPGRQIDNTYCVYRVKTDGSKYEKLSDAYSYGLFIFGDHLYFLKQHPDYSSLFTLYRMNLDGTSEESFPQNAKQAVAYKNRLYYNDGSGNLFSIDPNKEKLSVVMSGLVDRFTISGDKIIYTDTFGNLNVSSLDGKETVKIRDKGAYDIYSLNTYNDRIYIGECDINSFDYDKYGYHNFISSVDFEGNHETEIFDFYSTGLYMNLVGGRLMVFEYVRGGNEMTGRIKSLPAGGGDWIIFES